MVQRQAAGVEELADLGVGGGVAAVGQRGDACGVPGSRGASTVCCSVDLGEGASDERLYLIVVTAQGKYGRRREVGGGGDGVHLVSGSRIGGLAGGGERLVPSSAVDVGPQQR